MNVLIFGASGLVGNQLYCYLSNKGYSVKGTSTRRNSEFLYFNVLKKNNNSLIKKLVIESDLIINSIVINAFQINKTNIEDVLKINSVFPDTLNWFVNKYNKRLIQISTNSVYGVNNSEIYSEEMLKKPHDLYSLTKSLGEVNNKNSLNIRSSFIGYNPKIESGLIYRVFKKNKLINVENKMWHGSSTYQFSQFIEALIFKKTFSNKLFKLNFFNFVPNKPIPLYDLFLMINKIFNFNVKLVLNKEKKKSLILSNSLLLKNNSGLKILDFESSLNKIWRENCIK